MGNSIEIQLEAFAAVVQIEKTMKTETHLTTGTYEVSRSSVTHRNSPEIRQVRHCDLDAYKTFTFSYRPDNDFRIHTFFIITQSF